MIPLFVLSLMILDFCYARGVLQSLQQAADLACLSGALVADEEPGATEELTKHVFALNAPVLEGLKPRIRVRHRCRVELRVSYGRPALTSKILGHYFSFLNAEIRSTAEQRRGNDNQIKVVLVQ